MLILIAAHESGSANALVPVIRVLSGMPKVRVQVLATGYASRIFQNEGIPHLELPGGKGAGVLQAADRWLTDLSPDLLILGTAWEKNLEKAFLELAPAQGIRALSIVDNWSHFRERFTAFSGPGALYPDRIAVVDERARRQAVQEGLPPERLVITGQPHLESVAERSSRPALARQASELRRRWIGASSPETDRVVLFISEPFSIYSAPGTPYYRGYTEEQALEGLLEAARFIEKRLGLRIRVVVKLHPRESEGSAPIALAAASRNLLTEKDAPSLASVSASDAVVGMASMLLLEAALASRPAVSFEPNGKEEFAFHGSRIGAVSRTSTVRDLAEWLDAALTRPAATAPALAAFAHGEASHKVVEAALELAITREEAVG